MSRRFEIDGVFVEVSSKDIKTIRLSVCRPDARVKVSVPQRVPLAFVQQFVFQKMDWIKLQQQKIRALKIVPPVQYQDDEIHQVWGKSFSMKLIPSKRMKVEIKDENVLLFTPPDASIAKKEGAIVRWHKTLLRDEIETLLAKWQPVMGVKASSFLMQKMKSRWGTCNVRTHVIRLNSQLAKKHPDCLEYVLVHELVHLLEASHNARFKSLMSQFMPDWPQRKAKLAELPVD